MDNPITEMIRMVIREELQIILGQLKREPVKEDKLISIDEAIDVVYLSKSSIYRLVSSREIPHIKKGKRLFFSTKELERWLRDGRRNTSQEIDKEVDNYLRTQKKK